MQGISKKMNFYLSFTASGSLDTIYLSIALNINETCVSPEWTLDVITINFLYGDFSSLSVTLIYITGIPMVVWVKTSLAYVIYSYSLQNLQTNDS